ncbi:inorganic pyrophosphatase, variant [Sphaeroforma arctica JP610]|uniref:inorganic diphosphatase n=1 Tax=Sphaeroforma arctica JP610 TaxID=667725 RepID=A0A0L0FJB3_9EUKA|nr:inorganic pyrophosphatase, variant [Sphaeroforma arctica JP610]KNC76879.1 inorganic pyrophosphatase, variant [Sphaeroforma arctica JP610]|eukprot:XP_014150781.1 inorganic pyrophosphatase, variant [Sphaeroforma arctica JP610]
MSFTAVESGSPYTPEYRVYYKNAEGKLVNPWHDIPLKSAGGNFNMICEIPRYTNAKMEIATKETLGPIKQDVKKGNIRFVVNPFPHHGYIWNYGAFPQTWEDDEHVDPRTEAKGDNDPLDVCEIGQQIATRGEVYEVKILGLLAMIDDGETDWKIMAIRTSDPLASKLNDIGDIEKEMPGFLDATRDWFKVYKIADGKPANEFAFGGEYKDKEFALGVVEETNGFWEQLMAKGHKSLDLTNTTLTKGDNLADDKVAAVASAMAPKGEEASKPDNVNFVSFAHLK